MGKKQILTVVYAIYGLLCLAACVWTESAALWALNMALETGEVDYFWLALVPMAALGLAWGGEHCLAKMADKKVVAAVRILQIVMLLKWSAWWWEPVSSVEFLDLSFSKVAISPLLGLQIFSTVELLVKKPKSA